MVGYSLLIEIQSESITFQRTYTPSHSPPRVPTAIRVYGEKLTDKRHSEGASVSLVEAGSVRRNSHR